MLNLKDDSLLLSESLMDFKWPMLQQLGDATTTTRDGRKLKLS